MGISSDTMKSQGSPFPQKMEERERGIGAVHPPGPRLKVPLAPVGGRGVMPLRPVDGGGEGECRRWRHGEAVIGGGEP